MTYCDGGHHASSLTIVVMKDIQPLKYHIFTKQRHLSSSTSLKSQRSDTYERHDF